MQKAKGKVKVLLDGQGGDEVFGGYFFIGAYLRSLIRDKKLKNMYTNIPEYFSFLKEKGIHGFTSWIFPGLYNRTVRSFFSERSRILNRDVLKSLKNKEIFFMILIRRDS